MKITTSPSAGKILFRVTYVDSVFREAFVEARDSDEAETLVYEEIGDGVHHHAYDAFQNEMQASPAESRNRPIYYECGQ